MMLPLPVRSLRLRRLACLFFPAAMLSLTTVRAADSVQYPTDFRRWVHVTTGVVIPGVNPQLATEEGIHHVFANPKAVEGYASGDFADGSVIVYELRESAPKNGSMSEGNRRRVDVMIKDSSAYAGTGGWRFERFWGDDQSQDALHDTGTSCFQCHAKAKAHGFIFSQLK
ncbi:cytochrome C [Acidobacteria bacterium AB60]|nr:cytochrome C [Acidobacteria bacterium AB60]